MRKTNAGWEGEGLPAEPATDDDVNGALGAIIEEDSGLEGEATYSKAVVLSLLIRIKALQGKIRHHKTAVIIRR